MPPKRAPTSTATGIPAGLSWPRFMSAFSTQERAKGKAPTQTAISRAWRAYSGKTSPSRKVSTARKTPKKTSNARKSSTKKGKKAASPPMSPMSRFNEEERYTPDDALLAELVPSSGPAKTLEGEILRAANRIAYRWYNDGDDANSDTVEGAYEFLAHAGLTPHVPDAEESDNEDVAYSQYVDTLLRAAEKNARDKKGKYTPFDGDMDDKRSWETKNLRPSFPPAPKAASPKKSPTKKTTKKGKRYESDHALFEQLVPSSGPSKTLEGEILRAVNKIAYRWYNDGDGIDSPEVAMPYRFLSAIGFNEIPELVDRKQYNRYVDDLSKRTDEYVRSKGGRYTPFSGDMYDEKTWKGVKIRD